MKCEKEYEHVWLDAEAIENIVQQFKVILPKPDMARALTLSAQQNNVEWSFDALEELLHHLHDNECDYICVSYDNCAGNHGHHSYGHYGLRISARNRDILPRSSVKVSAPDRVNIAKVFNIVEEHAKRCRVEPLNFEAQKRCPTVFIGHGRSPLWRDLKDHLQDKHDYQIEAYESGERAGHAIRDILESMMKNSSFAILVMTGEDKTDDGVVRARQNVIHEVGLFQGRLGFNRVIVLKEEGVEDFSNMAGVHQIRFTTGNIRETFGDVLAVLRREFNSPSTKEA